MIVAGEPSKVAVSQPLVKTPGRAVMDADLQEGDAYVSFSELLVHRVHERCSDATPPRPGNHVQGHDMGDGLALNPRHHKSKNPS